MLLRCPIFWRLISDDPSCGRLCLFVLFHSWYMYCMQAKLEVGPYEEETPKHMHFLGDLAVARVHQGHCGGRKDMFVYISAWCMCVACDLSQDGSSDRSRQEMGHLSSILCSHKQHI